MGWDGAGGIPDETVVVYQSLTCPILQLSQEVLVIVSIRSLPRWDAAVYAVMVILV